MSKLNQIFRTFPLSQQEYLEWYLKTRRNILVINNAGLPIITNPIRVIGFFGAADFTEHITTKMTDVNLSLSVKLLTNSTGSNPFPALFYTDF
jgi:hypothetical protein